MFGILMSDFCIAPEANLFNIIVAGDSATDLGPETIQFYLVDPCPPGDPRDPDFPAIGVYAFALDAFRDANSSVTALDDVFVTLTDIGSTGIPSVDNAVEELITQVTLLRTNITGLVDETGDVILLPTCQRVRNDIWSPFIEGLCDGAIGTGVFNLFNTAIAGAVFGLFMILAGLPMMNSIHHPAGKAARRALQAEAGG